MVGVVGFGYRMWIGMDSIGHSLGSIDGKSAEVQIPRLTSIHSVRRRQKKDLFLQPKLMIQINNLCFYR